MEGLAFYVLQQGRLPQWVLIRGGHAHVDHHNRRYALLYPSMRLRGHQDGDGGIDHRNFNVQVPVLRTGAMAMRIFEARPGARRHRGGLLGAVRLLAPQMHHPHPLSVYRYFARSFLGAFAGFVLIERAGPECLGILPLQTAVFLDQNLNRVHWSRLSQPAT
jgi:hypothetical protein